MIKKILLFIIKIYQRTLSPDHGFGKMFSNKLGCRFYPSCSEYAHQALLKKTTGSALRLIIKRVIRCHPLATGGYDPI